MRIFHSLEEIRGAVARPAVTVGSFDGVHAGHRAILRVLRDAAARSGGESVVATLAPHPRQVLLPDEGSLKLLNSTEEKIRLLERAGVDNLLIIDFTPDFSRLDSETFVRRWLLEGIGARTIVTGYNHHFGRNREGNRDYLEKLRDQFEFDTIQLPKQDVGSRHVSSTVLRQLIREGDLAQARELLSEPYFFIARAGDGGRLEYDEPAKLFPPSGSYPVTVDDGTGSFPAGLTIGGGRELSLSHPSGIRSGQELIVRFDE